MYYPAVTSSPCTTGRTAATLISILCAIVALLLFTGTASANVFPQIASGESHSVAIKSDGTVWCWGLNSTGQLGNGTTENSSMPVLVSGIRNATAIAAGFGHTVAVRSDGTVWSWGLNSSGQLGDGTTNDSTVPVQVPGLTGVVAVVAGKGHTMALKSDGTAWAWGLNNKGQLGNNSTQDSPSPVQVNVITSGVIAISGSRGDHSMALTSDGKVWTWGDNSFGQIGNGGASPYNTQPVNVASGAIAISAGATHSTFLKTDLTVWAWGDNNYGQCGIDPYSEPTVFWPSQISGITGAQSISAGNCQTMALLNDGSAQALGRNNWGQLGNNQSGSNSYTPVAVINLNGIIAISSGANHTLTIKSDGTIWGWGLNTSGQLGLGHSEGTMDFPAVSPRGSLIFPQVAAGQKHTVALRNDGTVWAWGLNDNGQLGSAGGNSQVPSAVAGLSGIVSIATGFNHSVALKSDGTVWSWGDNSFGQLGDNNAPTDSFTPVQVSGLTGITSIAAARGNHVLALRNDGTVWAWGANGSGQLGNNGAPTDSSIPVQVSNLTGVTAIATGLSHSLAIRNDGTTWGWGDNSFGQLGQDPVALPSSGIPVQLSGITSALSVGAGDYHTIAVKSDGTVWGVGRNGSGQLGNNSFITTSTPVETSSISNPKVVSAGSLHTSAIKSDGSVWGWGQNDLGQLGNNLTANSPIPVQALTITQANAVSTGINHTIAATADGTVWGWGQNDIGQLGNDSLANSLIPVKSAGLSLNIYTPSTVATPAGGEYASAQYVTLTSNGAIAIFYTLDGSTPTYPATGTTQLYTVPVTIGSSTELKFFALDIAGNAEAVKTESYQITVPPVTTATPPGGTYASPQSVTLNADRGTIYYTVDGSTPTYPVSGTTQIFGAPILINSNTTLSFFARDTNGDQESVQSQYYTITAPPVTTANPPGGSYTSVQDVTLTSTKPGAIYYTTDGSTPTYPLSGTTQIYSGSISISYTTTLSFFARDTDGNQESVQTQTYTMDITPATTATPAGGTYTSVQVVTLAPNKAGTIYYTDDSSMPTYPVSGSTRVYTSPIIVSATTTLRYFLRDLDGVEEAVQAQTYTINIPPVTTIDPPGGTYPSGQTVTLTPNESGNVYYTLDGSDPTYPVSGTTQVYGGPLTLTYSTTIKYFARDLDGNQETVNSQAYAILQSLSVTVSGGNGSIVHSTPGTDINCTGSCSQDYLSGDVVVLTASPSATDNFTGWSGACTGTDVCSITMNSAISVTATFAPKPVISASPRFAAGHNHTLAQKSDGSLWAWGQNSSGQLGDGENTNHSSPVSVDTSTGLQGVESFAAGLSHSIALAENGTVWAWGDNAYGQIGTGPANIGLQYSSPVQVPGISNIIAIAAGEYHSLALRNDGTVWVWGRNNFGQLGMGDSANRSAPEQVTGISNITAIAAKGNFSLALISTGTVSAWGQNSFGQLGNQSYNDSNTPVSVVNLVDVSAIAAGYTHAVALKRNGTVIAWGENETGGLGDGTNITSNMPVTVSNLTDAVSVSAGYRFSTAVKRNGDVVSWGWNIWGQLGNGSNDDSWVPAQITALSSVAAVSSGNNHTIAMKNDGSILSWGANTYGALGDGTTSDSTTPIPTLPPLNLGPLPPVTTAAPPGGTYTDYQSVTLTANEPSMIYYTVDGTTPTFPITGTTQLYSSPIPVNSSMTINFFAISQSSSLSEEVKTADYSINLVPVTTVTPPGGTYTTPQSVTLSSNKPGDVYYTLDGTTPTYPASGTTQVYSAPLSISTNTTLKYFARDLDGYQEDVQTQLFTMNIPPVTTASPAGGTYSSVQSVSLTSNETGVIYFTIDGSTPTYPVSGTTQVYSSPIAISTNTTLNYFARDVDGNLETVKSQVYTMNIPPVTTASPSGGIYTFAQTVTLTSNESGTVIYFTVDGSTPTYPASGTTQIYSTPVAINATTTLKYFGRDIDGNQETVKTQNYTINIPPVTTADPPGGIYPPGQTVTLTADKSGSIYYTTDGTTPTFPESGTTQVYGGPITINTTTTLKYFARDTIGLQESVKTQTYEISPLPFTTASPPGGTYTSIQTVALTSNIPSTIYYTVDGTDPTYPVTGTTQTYNAPITISANTILKFFAIDLANSNNIEAVNTLTYTINLPVLHELAVTIQGGTGSVVSSSPTPDISCATSCSQNYEIGTVVTLTASDSPSDTFVGWSGACSGTDPCILTMDSPRSVTATFAPIGIISTPPLVAAGYMHTVSLKGDGSVWAWGNNIDGQLGNGSYLASTFPQKVSLIQGVTAIAAGDYHTLALRNDGTVWAWGYNNYGQLGDGSDRQASTTPVRVVNLSGVIAISAGAGHSVALKNDGTVWAWGNNLDGQLGNNTGTESNTPVQVGGISEVSAIAAGWLHTVALKNDGTVWAWGNNTYGQLGNELGTEVYWPVQVAGLSGMTAIAAGGYHSVALKNDTTVWSWGKNTKGQLGDGTYIQHTSPVQAIGLFNVVGISAGGSYTVARNSYGTLWIWGNDSYYDHPFMGSVDSASPVEITGVTDVSQVAAGYFHTIAATSSGSLSSWGYNISGQLGNGTTFVSSLPLQVVGLNISAIACYARIDSVCYGSIAEAYIVPPTAGDATVMAQSRTFNEPLNFARDVNLTMSGGYDATFTSTIGDSVLTGPSLIVASGSVIIGGNVTVVIVSE